MYPIWSNIFLVVAGIAAMLLLFISFLFIFLSSQRKKLQYQKERQQLQQQQQNQLIEAAVRSEELERHRIAEQLHDEVGAILSSCKLHLQGMKAISMDDRDRQLYAKGKELLDEGIQKVRGISHNLHSNILKELGLNEAISHFVNKISQGTLLHAATELDSRYETVVDENDISIYRMVQELINNILKHAGATQLHIHSAFNEPGLSIIITHNGNGLSQQRFEQLRYSKEGLGLKNIQNRIILLKGSIHFDAAEGHNAIKLYIP